MMAILLAFSLDKCRIADPPTAPVRKPVKYVPSNNAVIRPVLLQFKRGKFCQWRWNFFCGLQTFQRKPNAGGHFAELYQCFQFDALLSIQHQ